MQSGFLAGAAIVVGVTLLFMAALTWALRRAAAGAAGRWSLRAAVAMGAGGVAVAGMGAFLLPGAPPGVSPSPPSARASSPEGQQGEKGHAGDMEAMVARLADKLKADPDNAQGWLLLGKASNSLGRHRDAAQAFEKAIALLPPDASLLADYVDAYVVGNDRQWDAKARAALGKALATDGRHLKTLALAGSEAYVRKDYKQALSFWERMAAAAPPGSPEAASAQANVAEVRALIEGKPPAGR